MREQEVMALVERTAMLMEQYERRCSRLDQQLAAVTRELQQLAQQVPAVIGRSADDSLRALSGQVMGRISQGLTQPVDAYEQRLRSAGHLLADGAQDIAAQIRRMERLHRAIVWKTVGAVLGSLLLMLVGSIWLSRHYYGVIRDHQIAGDLLKAYNGADVVRCGERLCANIDDAGKRYGDQGQYRPVRPR